MRDASPLVSSLPAGRGLHTPEGAVDGAARNLRTPRGRTLPQPERQRARVAGHDHAREEADRQALQRQPDRAPVVRVVDHHL